VRRSLIDQRHRLAIHCASAVSDARSAPSNLARAVLPRIANFPKRSEKPRRSRHRGAEGVCLSSQSYRRYMSERVLTSSDPHLNVATIAVAYREIVHYHRSNIRERRFRAEAKSFPPKGSELPLIFISIFL